MDDKKSSSGFRFVSFPKGSAETIEIDSYDKTFTCWQLRVTVAGSSLQNRSAEQAEQIDEIRMLK